jgi:hypothetical protein
LVVVVVVKRSSTTVRKTAGRELYKSRKKEGGPRWTRELDRSTAQGGRKPTTLD